MSTVGTIAIQVFRESVSDRVLYSIGLFAALMISGAYLVGQLTADQDVKIIKDLGLSAAAVFGLLIAVFIGVGLISKEVERRSIYTLLSKPVRRHEVVLGKYVGVMLTLAVNLAGMAAALYVVLGYMSATESEEIRRGWEAPATDPVLLKAFYMIFVQLMLVTAIALFFSTFSTSLLAVALTLGVYVTGHFSADLRRLADVIEAPIAASVAQGLSYVLPDLSVFDVAADVVHAQPVTAGYMALTSVYAGAYIGALLLGAMFVFSRRDFT